MRLLTFLHNAQVHVGIRHEQFVLPLTQIARKLPNSIKGILEVDGLSLLGEALVSSKVDRIPISEITHLPLIPQPGKIICIGRNYVAHAKEQGSEAPVFPEIFYRGATSLVGHEGEILRPACSDKLDFEGEFAAIIGKRCRHATVETALDYVAGYSLFNDATLRDYQRFASQWTIGKNFDSTGGFGPELVTPDELPLGLAGLTIRTHLNGELMQEGQVDDLSFPVARLIEILSQCMTLEPGDVIVTGTPSGVGAARTPPIFMKHGDTIEVSIPELGVLRHHIRDEVI